jgi:hypothetical protein
MTYFNASLALVTSSEDCLNELTPRKRHV